MTTIDAERPAKLDMGQVFSDTFGAIRRSWLLLGGFGLITIVPSLLNGLFTIQDPAAASRNALNPVYWVVAIIGVIVGLFIYTAQLSVAVSTLQGRAPSFGDAARAALPKVLPLLLMTIVSTLAITFASFLLLVPGLILMVMWAVALPALIAERVGPFEALGRSRSLTRGNRWRVFGVYLVLIILLLVFEAAALLFILPLRAMPGPGALGGMVIGSTIISLLFSIFLTTFVSAIYVQLRRLKDGVGGANLGEVFD